jgi:hypothetical protein
MVFSYKEVFGFGCRNCGGWSGIRAQPCRGGLAQVHLDALPLGQFFLYGGGEEGEVHRIFRSQRVGMGMGHLRFREATCGFQTMPAGREEDGEFLRGREGLEILATGNPLLRHGHRQPSRKQFGRCAVVVSPRAALGKGGGNF